MYKDLNNRGIINLNIYKTYIHIMQERDRAEIPKITSKLRRAISGCQRMLELFSDAHEAVAETCEAMEDSVACSGCRHMHGCGAVTTAPNHISIGAYTANLFCL